MRYVPPNQQPRYISPAYHPHFSEHLGRRLISFTLTLDILYLSGAHSGCAEWPSSYSIWIILVSTTTIFEDSSAFVTIYKIVREIICPEAQVLIKTCCIIEHQFHISSRRDRPR